MAYRLRRLNEVSMISRHFHSGAISRRKISPLLTRENVEGSKDNLRRCSSLSETNNNSLAHADTLEFIKSRLSEFEGPNHRWLNYMDQNGVPVNKDGILLVLMNAYIEDSALNSNRNCAAMFEKVKFLKQRFPKLNVFGLQCGSSMKSVATQAQIVRTLMEEYITFPVLILDKDFLKMTNGPSCLLFEGSTNRLLHHELGVELEGIVRAIEELDVPLSDVSQKDDTDLFHNANGDVMRQHEIMKEPYAASALRNLLLYYPGCVSVDEDGNRLFISDSNHHRIIITDGKGKVLDCIGSSPGFEDGEFESAKLFRPAASFYDSDEECLYFVDSENNAIRRADMERRMLETVFPVSVSRTTGIWSWILDKLGLARKVDDISDEFNLDSLSLPWHLLKSGENDLIILNRSFEMSWIMDMNTWEIKKVTRGLQNILENYGHMIEEKVNMLGNDSESSLSHQLQNSISAEGIPYAGLMSSVVKFHGCTIFCDAAAHRVLKCLDESRTTLDIQFSDLRVLGLPYWLVCPLETVFNSKYLHRPWKEHHHRFTVLPGRCDIRVKVDLPKGIELVAPLEEECIWRQVRGSAVDLSGSEEVETNKDKVGVAQQWFDELDNLAFSKSVNESESQLEDQFIDQRSQDMHKVHFSCEVNLSPGTGEVVVSAVLYLKLHKQEGSRDTTLEATKILNVQEEPSQRNNNDDACLSLLLETGRDLQDFIFMRPLHLRIRLDCLDHPKAATQKEIISTDTTLEVNVSLD
ncbi:uncharacterized protein A4U43_C07F19580 [Asparagus officinalis]|uniref:Uncharacterized protein n=1 Tax=Asparagus officinalis TaxID=4686 RepID=A0A5P1EIF2_ASPOF|nr:uncharacterized protein LOC109848422 isoform X2 [Asparagus officinalis]ONK63850.1 uncharacterized protein A4U43_C07F19580 [Asparagus officinalis]